MKGAQMERAPAGGMMIGLNWLSLHTKGDTIVWHNGGTGGYRTFIGFEPSRKIGVVVLANSGGEGADDIGMHLLNPELPLAPKPVPPKQRTAIEVSPAVLAHYVGAYPLAPNFVLDVTLDGGALYVQATNQPRFRLWPETPKDFFLKEVDAQITFVADSGRMATALILHQNGVDQRGARRP